MAAKPRTKKLALSCLACILAAACLLVGCASNPDISADPAPLSAEQVEGMREDYPICPGGSSIGSMLPTELKDFLNDDYRILYAEVSGPETTETRTINVENVGGEEFDFYEVPLQVLYDSSGTFNKGEEIHIYQNTLFRDGMPAFEEGDRFVALAIDCFPFHQETSDIPRVEVSLQGFYYITDDGHAIAAYEEPEYFQQNGVGLATLLENYEEIYAEMTAEQADQ